jgi:hypothetical protein
MERTMQHPTKGENEEIQRKSGVKGRFSHSDIYKFISAVGSFW